MSEATTFTGERLHEDDALFGVDLARHRAAYRFAIARAAGGAVVDLGCGTGYGTRELAEAGALTVGVDRVPPLAAARSSAAAFVRADLRALPIVARRFRLVTSFQVIEHLDDPTAYLDAMASLVEAGGEVLLTTPNVRTSLGVNPYHVHEYTADELEFLLKRYFDEVEVRGVFAGPAVQDYFQARRRRIERIMRLDPLGLRERLPRKLIETAFSRLAVLVRRGIQRNQGLPEADVADFPIAAATDDCLDLLALCRGARA